MLIRFGLLTQADNVGHKWSISALNKHLRQPVFFPTLGLGLLDLNSTLLLARSTPRSSLECPTQEWVERVGMFEVKQFLGREESEHLHASGGVLG